MKFNTLLPELYVESFERSIFFYSQILQWKIEYTRESPRFAFLSYFGSQIMIQELLPSDLEQEQLRPPYGKGMNFQIETPTVQKIIDQLKKHDYPLKRGIKESWYEDGEVAYGCREILVSDPDGYLLRFSQDVGEKILQ